MSRRSFLKIFATTAIAGMLTSCAPGAVEAINKFATEVPPSSAPLPTEKAPIPISSDMMKRNISEAFIREPTELKFSDTVINRNVTEKESQNFLKSKDTEKLIVLTSNSTEEGTNDLVLASMKVSVWGAGGEAKITEDGTLFTDEENLLYVVRMNRETGQVGKITPLFARMLEDGTTDGSYYMVDDPSSVTAENLEKLDRLTLLTDEGIAVTGADGRAKETFGVVVMDETAPTPIPSRDWAATLASYLDMSPKPVSAKAIEATMTPEMRMPVNDPTPMDYEALRAGPAEMMIAGEAVSIEDFVRKYVETGAFSDWLVHHAEMNGTLPKGDPPKGLAKDDLSTYQINAYDTKRTASKLIQRGISVGNLNSIGMVIGEQDYAVSQGVWGITIPNPPAGDRNRDGELHLWVRGVVLATGDPEHPYVGAPVVHTALEEMSGGFDGRKAYMRGYCRPDVRFGIVMNDPVAATVIINTLDKQPYDLYVTAALHSLGLDNPGFALPHGAVMRFNGSEANPDSGLRPIRMEGLPVMGSVLRGEGFDWREVRTAVFVDRSF